MEYVEYITVNEVDVHVYEHDGKLYLRPKMKDEEIIKWVFELDNLLKSKK